MRVSFLHTAGLCYPVRTLQPHRHTGHPSHVPLSLSAPSLLSFTPAPPFSSHMVTNPKLCFWGLLLTGELSLHKLGDWSEEIDDEPMEDGASLTSAGSGWTRASRSPTRAIACACTSCVLAPNLPSTLHVVPDEVTAWIR